MGGGARRVGGRDLVVISTPCGEATIGKRRARQTARDRRRALASRRRAPKYAVGDRRGTRAGSPQKLDLVHRARRREATGNRRRGRRWRRCCNRRGRRGDLTARRGTGGIVVVVELGRR